MTVNQLKAQAKAPLGIARQMRIDGRQQVLSPVAAPQARKSARVDIAAQARRDGVRDLRQSGLVKVKAGVTSLEEVMLVTNE